MLIQERLWCGDPWRVLVCCILLNRTQGKTAEPILRLLFEAWPDADALRQAKPEALRLTIEVLGFGEKRTEYLLSMSKAWSLMEASGKDVKTVDPESFLGCGAYAREAWNMLVLGRRDFIPKDKELRKRMEELRSCIR